MEPASPYVITVASEKGGVGKTTIATNLAVYLKALREDLPVTIVSFDNHFSVDSMFTIGRHREQATVATLFAGVPAGELAVQGEYGVQFIPSERFLVPPDADCETLHRHLRLAALSGILVIDTRPILDYFTRSALIAADLVLAPVKDRASLVNAASLQNALSEGEGNPERLWLVPSLVDARMRLRQGLGLRDFLTFAARERDYQVTETFIAKSPKVEGLATNLTSRVYPILTHARSTAVHRQFKDLAEFVLQRYETAEERPAPVAMKSTPVLSPGTLRRLAAECPVCGETAPQALGHFFFDTRSRRRGMIHPGCLEDLLRETELKMLVSCEGLLLYTLQGPGLRGSQTEGLLALYDSGGEEIACERTGNPEGSRDEIFWRGATGRIFAELCREILVVSLAPAPVETYLAGEGRKRFAALCRQVLREMMLE